uniref:hypothetical protein n=1 Tax=Fulvivirga sp. TaxID=1931237 RepID=UPI00404B6050
MEETQEKKKSGCLRTLFGIAMFTVIPILVLSLLIDFVKNQTAVDTLAKSLIPFQNDYFGFQDYFVTVEHINSGWTWRFLISFVPSLMLIAIVNSILESIFKENKVYYFFVRVLGIFLLFTVFSFTWFVPDTLTHFDAKARTVNRTQFGLEGMRSAIIPIEANSLFYYEYKLRKTGVHEYVKFLYIRLKTGNDSTSTYLLGVQNMGSYTVNALTEDQEAFERTPPSEKEKAYAEDLIRSLQSLYY